MRGLDSPPEAGPALRPFDLVEVVTALRVWERGANTAVTASATPPVSAFGAMGSSTGLPSVENGRSM
jgi:hypothetical protein